LIDKYITLNQPVGEIKLSSGKTVMRVLYTKCEMSHFVRRREPIVLLFKVPINE